MAVRWRVRVGVVGLAALTACGDDGGRGQPVATTVASTSAAAPTTPATAGSSTAAFPLTVVNALGAVTVPARAQRAVAIGSAELDALLALGVVPVAYGTYDDGLLAYQEAALAGAPPPEIFSLADGIPLETVARFDPDLIVSLSWTDADNYPELSAIAPTVAYVQAAWGDPWQTQVRQIATSLGRDDDGEALIGGVEAAIAEVATAHPELVGRSVTFTSADEGGALCSVDQATSPVLVFLRELGLQPLLDDPASSYSAEISLEQLERIDADIVMLFGAQAELEANALYRQLDAVADDGVIWLDDTMANAVNSPTPLAIPAFLDTVVPQLVAASG